MSSYSERAKEGASSCSSNTRTLSATEICYSFLNRAERKSNCYSYNITVQQLRFVVLSLTKQAWLLCILKCQERPHGVGCLVELEESLELFANTQGYFAAAVAIISTFCIRVDDDVHVNIVEWWPS